MLLDTIFQSIKNFFLRADLSLWSVSAIKAAFKPTDIVDILIVAYLIYRVILWIKKTRAWSLLKGIFIILFVSMLAYFMNFYTIIWIVSNTFGVGLTAVIILFQPEMRKALEQIGRGKVLGFLVAADDQEERRISKQTIKEIIDSANEMSRMKTGALIVIENDVLLLDQEQAGIMIDAVVSKQLLLNIFEDKTPLHDGAIIIRNNRIAAATCILPLSQNHLERELGTRHRAAVGTSEISDAFILVVSEETGDISIASGGILHRKLNEKDLWEILYKDDDIQKKKRVRWKGRRKNDQKAK